VNSSSASSAAETPTVYTRNSTGLVRELRFVDFLAYTITSGTPLTSVLILGLFTVALFPRMNFFLALFISGVVSIPVFITFALLTATFPKLGGDYVFNSRILHPAIGFGVNLGFILSQSLVAGTAAAFVSELALNPTLLIIGTVTNNSTVTSWASYFTVSNGNGVFITSTISILLISVLSAIRTKLLFRLMTIMLAIFTLAALVDVVILLFTSQSDFANTFNNAAGAGAYQKVVAAGAGKGLYPTEGGYSFSSTVGSMFYAIGWFIFMFWGTYIAGEVRKAGQRTRMLSAMVGGGVIQIVVVLVSLIAFYHAVGENFAISATAGNQTSGIASFPYYAALATGNSTLAVILAIGLMFWTIPLINIFLSVMQRGFFVYAFERLLPSWVASVNERTHTPLVAVAISAVLAILGSAFNAYNANFATALTLATFPSFIVILVVGISAVVMSRRRPDLFAGSPADWRVGGVPVLLVAGAFTIIVVGTFIVVPFFYQQQVGLAIHPWLPWATAIAPVALIAIGVVWWYIARVVNRSKGVNLDLIYKTIPPD
jgi:amino acid transporter